MLGQLSALISAYRKSIDNANYSYKSVGMVVLFLLIALPITVVAVNSQKNLFSNASDDNEKIPPSVSVSAPINNSIIPRNGVSYIETNASDNVAIARVEVYVDNNLVCSLSGKSEGYKCPWKVPAKFNESYTITVKAFDTSSNSTSSVPISVTAR